MGWGDRRPTGDGRNSEKTVDGCEIQEEMQAGLGSNNPLIHKVRSGAGSLLRGCRSRNRNAVVSKIKFPALLRVLQGGVA